MKPQDIRWRLFVFVVGVLLVLGVEFPLGSALGTNSRLTMPLLAVAYAIVAALLSLWFQHAGWRIALWLLAFDIFIAVGNVVMTNVPIPWQVILKTLLEEVPVVIAAFVGAVIGSYLRRRLANSQTDSP